MSDYRWYTLLGNKGLREGEKLSLCTVVNLMHDHEQRDHNCVVIRGLAAHLPHAGVLFHKNTGESVNCLVSSSCACARKCTCLLVCVSVCGGGGGRGA